MQLLIRGLAGFLSQPDNNRRAKVRFFLEVTNIANTFSSLFYQINTFFRLLRHYSHRNISFEGRFVKEIIADNTPSIS